MKSIRTLNDYLRRLHVKESRAEILTTPNWPRALRELTDAAKWRERDAKVERQMAEEARQKIAA